MESFNRRQKRASSSRKETGLVVAGAGTGKTRTLVEKVKNISRTAGSDPGYILVLTFSRKAAEELRERLSMFATPDYIRSMTFHSFSWNLIMTYREEYLSLKKIPSLPALLSEEEAALLWEQVPCPDDFPTVPRRVIRDLAQAEHLSSRVLSGLERTGLAEPVEILKQRYRLIKQERNVMDYNDCLTEALYLVENAPGIRESVSSSLDYLLVDEFQDSSDLNIRLVKALLSGGHAGFFAVGDDWQSIYAFRGAMPGYLVRFRRYFPDARIYYLTVNYRSRPEIVRVGSGFIRRNRDRTRKYIRSARPRGGTVHLFLVRSFESELECVAGIIRREQGRGIAVLYRNNWQGDMYRSFLGRNGLSAVLLTFHSSKGLEFPVVIVTGISDMIIPNRSGGIEEERRLMYVALTRAMDSLYVVGHENERGRMARFARELSLKAERFNPPR